MPSATVRISPRGHFILSRLAAESGKPMPEVLDEALEVFRRQTFLLQAAAAFDSLTAGAADAYREENSFDRRLSRRRPGPRHRLD